MAASQQSGEAIAQSFCEICSELGCEPVAALLECLQDNNPVVKVPSIQDGEQLYAVCTILPFANMQELDLSGLQLGSAQWCALLESVCRCSGLRVLSIKGCSLGALGVEGEEQVARQLGACCMAVLDASQNQLGDGFMSALSRSVLLRGADMLTVLDLSENCIGDNGAAALAATLAAAGLQCPLKQLDLSFNRLGDSAARALAGMLAAVPLLALELEGNQVSDAGGLALGDALKQALCLQRLNLNSNHLGSSTLTSIADAINVHAANLQELAVAGTSGSEQGIAALLTAACKSKQLHLLDVRGLPLAGKAVDAVCQLLRSSCPLVTMRLDVASREAAETVAVALPDRPSLMHFMMGGSVPEHVLSFIAATLSSNAINKVQAASRSVSPAPQQPRSSTPTQLLVQHRQQHMQSPDAATPSVTLGGPAHYNLARPFSGGTARMPLALSPNSSSGSLANSTGTPQRGSLLFGSPGSSGRPSMQHRSPVSAGRVNVHTLSMQARRASVIDNQGLAGLASGGAANKAAEVFKRHDMDNSGYLDAEEMMSALQELGMLEGMRPKQLGKFLSNAIREADTDKDGRVSIDEFTAYYERLARHYAEASRQGRITARRKAPEVPLEAPSDEALKRTFRTYCRLPIGQGRQVGGSVQQINAAQFNQLCRDAQILEPAGPLSQCAIDIIFTRSKPPGSRRLPFKHFLSALAAVADEAGVAFTSVSTALGHIDMSSMQQQATEACTAANNLSRRHSIGSCCAHTQLSISDLTDTRVGPNVAQRSSSATPTAHEPATTTSLLLRSAGRQVLAGRTRPSSAVTFAGPGSAGSTPWSLQRAPAASAAVTPGDNWGTRATSPSWTPRSGSSLTPMSALDKICTPKAERLLQLERQARKAEQERQQQQQNALLEQQQQRREQQQQQQHFEALQAQLQADKQLELEEHRKKQVQAQESAAAAAAEQQQKQQKQAQTHAVQVLAAHDAVQNPLYEGDSEASAGGAMIQTNSICHRLLALERKILQRGSVAGGSAAGAVHTAAAMAPGGGLEQRVAELEVSAEQTREQLASLLSQQDELKGLLARLLEGLEGAGLSTPAETNSSIKALTKTVESLSAEVASLRAKEPGGAEAGGSAGLQEQLSQIAANMDKRHTRVETAIYQVAHQVDLLDARVKQEQQSTLRTLQTLLTGSSPGAAEAVRADSIGAH